MQETQPKWWGREHTAQLFYNHQLPVPAVVSGLPHAYLLCKPYFFRTLWITPQFYIKPNLPLPYLGPCPTTKIQSTSSFLAEYHHPAPLYNCLLHSINCPSWPILTWQIKSCTVELNQHQGQYCRSYLKHGGQLSQHSLHIRITWRAL